MQERLHNLLDARHTPNTYIKWVRRVIHFHSLKHPKELGAKEINLFMSDLASKRRLGTFTQTQALSALLVSYRRVFKLDIEYSERLVDAQDKDNDCIQQSVCLSPSRIS